MLSLTPSLALINSIQVPVINRGTRRSAETDVHYLEPDLLIRVLDNAKCGREVTQSVGMELLLLHILQTYNHGLPRFPLIRDF